MKHGMNKKEDDNEDEDFNIDQFLKNEHLTNLADFKDYTKTHNKASL